MHRGLGKLKVERRVDVQFGVWWIMGRLRRVRAYIMAGLNRVQSGQVNLGATDPLRTLFQHETRRNFSKMAIYETRVSSVFAKIMTGPEHL